MEKRGYPTIEEAERLLREGEARNPGPWGDHCRVAALCAQRIAGAVGMVGEKAYVLGLLHDMGRRVGVTGMRHVIDGHNFLKEMGYDEAARICLTHSFAVRDISTYIGKNDLTPEELRFLTDYIAGAEYDDYDRLMQVCDSIAMAEGAADMETRMSDVKRRHGYYPQVKWDKHMELGRYFEERAGKSLLEIVGDCKI